MPLLVYCADLQPGMRLAEAFLLRNRMMLPGGKVLDKDDVATLRAKYPDLSLRIGDPILDSMAEFEDDSQDREVAATATQQIARSLASVQERFASNTDVGKMDFASVRSTAHEVMDFLKSNPVSAALLNRSTDPESYLTEHAGNVFYLCLLLGAAVRNYVIRERTRQTAAQGLSTHIAMDLLPLGLGAMFMDLGMYPLQHLFKPGTELTEEDRAAIREHPNTGAEMLPDTLPAGVKMVVRTHHENFDGSGYPGKMAGANLHIFTRIIRICDAYDAATAAKVYAAAKSPARTIWEMTVGPSRHCYDPVLTKVFMSLIQPFPIGAKLKLTDGRHAIVVRYNRKSPFFPNVIIAFDEHHQRLEKIEGPLDLLEGGEHRIAAFGGEDLSYIYDKEAPTLDMSSREVFSDLLAAAYP